MSLSEIFPVWKVIDDVTVPLASSRDDVAEAVVDDIGNEMLLEMLAVKLFDRRGSEMDAEEDSLLLAAEREWLSDQLALRVEVKVDEFEALDPLLPRPESDRES